MIHILLYVLSLVFFDGRSERVNPHFDFIYNNLGIGRLVT